MAKDKYEWWMSRFKNMGRYFDAFRIDHILGFFRIWEIPTDCVWGLLGYFNPSMPLSVSEIEHYGFWFDRDRYIIPHITRHHLYNLFGDNTDEIIGSFFNHRCHDRYVFKPEFATQRDLENSFVRNGLLPKYSDILDKLLSLYCEVIFIEDRANAGYYHPRINVMKSQSFAELSDHEKWCIQRIHDEYFYHRHTNQWSSEAMRKLPALLNTTDMLVCGEDLGMVPACVPEVMSQLQILSLEVQRMPKETTQRYVNLDAVPYLSVCCTGTHDTSPMRMWWRENRDNTQWFYNNILHQGGAAPEDLSPELAQQIVDMHVNSKSMWAILPWQDYMACDGANRFPNPDAERINDPSNPRHIWCWRMHIEL
jgi:4-alpha-glucanotransferase